MLSNSIPPYPEPPTQLANGTGTEAARPRILVLMATFNGSRWIREQMESILAQEGVDLRIAVRDDGSTDGTRWELTRFAEDVRIRVVASTTASGSAAGNFLTLIGEHTADTFDCVAFADQDDVWNRDKLERACRMLAATQAAGYSSATVAAWEDGRQQVMKPSGAPTT